MAVSHRLVGVAMRSERFIWSSDLILRWYIEIGDATLSNRRGFPLRAVPNVSSGDALRDQVNEMAETTA